MSSTVPTSSSIGSVLRYFGAFTLGYIASSFGPDLGYEVRSRYIDWYTEPMSDEEKLQAEFHDTQWQMVYPSDLDRNGHVNNARFIRELNFSRKSFFWKIGVWPILRKQNRNMVVQAQTIRYRKELSGVGSRFKIKTWIVGFSDRDSVFYVESRFQNNQDFTLAVHHCKYKIVKGTGFGQNFEGPKKPSEILKSCGFQAADLQIMDVDDKGNNPFIDRWSEANEYSSHELNPRQGSGSPTSRDRSRSNRELSASKKRSDTSKGGERDSQNSENGSVNGSVVRKHTM